MPSSIEVYPGLTRQRQFSIWVCVLLAACSATPPQGQNAAAPTLAATDLCKIQGGALTLQESAAVAVLRSNVESGLLYTIPAAAGVSACGISVKSGVIMLEYRFKDGGRLHVKRDSRIEYTEQVARIHLAREKNHVAVLADAERVAFGMSGCGIDWQRPETHAVVNDTGLSETLFYGDVCNCRAGFRRDAAGQVVELMLRSAC